MPRLSEPSPYVEFDRSQWRALRMSTPMKLTEDEVLQLRGLGEKLDLLEVEEVYLPLARLIHLQVGSTSSLRNGWAGLPPTSHPSGTSFVTTAPAPTKALSPTVTPLTTDA